MRRNNVCEGAADTQANCANNTSYVQGVSESLIDIDSRCNNDFGTRCTEATRKYLQLWMEA